MFNICPIEQSIAKAATLKPVKTNTKLTIKDSTQPIIEHASQPMILVLYESYPQRVYYLPPTLLRTPAIPSFFQLVTYSIVFPIVQIYRITYISCMNQDFTVVGFQLLQNSQVQLHTQQELQKMSKKHLFHPNYLTYNQKLSTYLEQFARPNQGSQQYKAKHKKLMKEISKMDQLNETDKIAIANHSFSSQAQLILKVQNTQNITPKQRKIILQHQL